MPSLSRFVVVDDLPWLEAKNHVLFQETTERWGSECDEYPQGRCPRETKLWFMGLVKKWAIFAI